jgi:hypothetical protein
MQARWTRQIQEATSKPESTFLWWVEWTTPQRGWHLFGFGLCGSSSAPLIRMPFPFAGVAPFAFGRRPLSRASISFPPPLPLSKGKVPLGPASTLRLTLRLRNRKAFASLHSLVRGLGGVWGYPLGAFRPPYACHTKQGSATFETSKSNHFWSNPHRHGHRALMRMVADGCEQLRNV